MYHLPFTRYNWEGYLNFGRWLMAMAMADGDGSWRWQMAMVDDNG